MYINCEIRIASTLTSSIGLTIDNKLVFANELGVDELDVDYKECKNISPIRIYVIHNSKTIGIYPPIPMWPGINPKDISYIYKLKSAIVKCDCDQNAIINNNNEIEFADIVETCNIKEYIIKDTMIIKNEEEAKALIKKLIDHFKLL